MLTPNSYIRWNQLFPLLNINSDGATLPLKVVCPKCENRTLVVYGQGADLGHWSSCACGYCGDMVELASTKWDGIDLKSTCKRLCALEMPIDPEVLKHSVMEKYEELVFRRKLMRELWETARAADPNDYSHAREMLSKLKIGVPDNKEQWISTFGKFIGILTPNQIKAAFVSNIKHQMTEETIEIDADRSFPRPMLNKKSTYPILTVPFFSLPNYVSGFMFIDHDMKTDIKHTGIHSMQEFKLDVGLAIFPAIDAVSPQFRDYLIVLADPISAIKLQANAIKHTGKLVPVVSTPPESKCYTERVWHSMPIKKAVFYCNTLNVSTIKQAKAIDASIVTRESMASKAATQLQDGLQYEHVINLLISKAVDWQSAVDAAVGKWPISEVEDLVSRCDFSDEQLDIFLTRCTTQTRERIEDVLRRKLFNRSVLAKGEVITTRLDGLFWARKRQYITNFVLVIDTIFQYPKRKQMCYGGYIDYCGNKYPFFAEYKSKTSTAAWLDNFAFENKIGALYYDSSWVPFIFEIGIRLGAPRMIKVADTVGWNEDQCSFVLPNFSISAIDGTITQAERAPRYKKPAPCSKLELEELSPAIAANALDFRENTTTFWAFFGCFMRNILAPAFNKPMCGIGLIGDGARTIGLTSAMLMGAIEPSLSSDYEHNWPSIDLAAAGALARGAEFAPHTIKALRLGEFAKQAATSDWHGVRNESQLVVNGGLGLAIAGIMTAYLSDVCKRRLKIASGENLTDRVFSDIEAWADRSFGNSEPIRAARSMVSPGDNSSSRANRLLLLILLSTKTSVADDLVTNRRRRVFRKDAEDGTSEVVVPLAYLHGLLTDNAAKLIDMDYVCDCILKLDNRAQIAYRYDVESLILPMDLWDELVAKKVDKKLF